MSYKLSFSGRLPSTAEWLLIIGFIAGALGLATKTFVLSAQQGSIILFAIGVLALLTKVISQTPTPVAL